MPPKATLTLAALLASGAAALASDRIVVNFVDDRSRIGYAQLVFDGDEDGSLTLFERWCFNDSRMCDARIISVPAGFKRFFETEIKAPVTIELDDVIIRLNEFVGLDARLIATTSARGEVFRDFQILQGDNRPVAAHPEAQPTSIITLTADDGSGEEMLVYSAGNGDETGDVFAGVGTVVRLPASMCGQIAETCTSFTFEPAGEAFPLWVNGQTSQDEPEFVFHEDLEITLFRDGNDLAAEIIQYLDNDQQRHVRFGGSVAVGNNESASSALDCTPREPSIGSVDYHIFRDADGVCIGTLSWAVVPDPIATIKLARDWCGAGQCDALQLASDSFKGENFPTRFWEGKTNRPSLELQPSDDGWGAPVGLFTSDGRIMIRMAPAARANGDNPASTSIPASISDGETYKISEIPGPLGIYAILQDRTDLEGIANIGDNLCLFSPVIYPRGGRIWFKELGTPINGNPYRITSWMECSRFNDGPENCVRHQGVPDAPNPVGSQSGFDYTPIGDGHFKICQQGDDGDCALLYACVGGDRPLTFDREFPAGGNMVEAMLATHDGQSPGFRYIDNETILIEE